MTSPKNIKGLDYLNIALLAFAGLGLELVLIWVEPLIYGQPVLFENWTIMSHWIVTCILWATVIFLILMYAYKTYDFKLNESFCKVKPWQYALVIVLIALALFSSYSSWGGFKAEKEFEKLGNIKFILQYLYYFFETGLFTLIIVFAQKAFEKWFKNESIPYGGIICAVTWGFAHIFTKSSIETGLLSAILGFGFGSVYLLLNRDIRKTFPVIFLMFVL